MKRYSFLFLFFFPFFIRYGYYGICPKDSEAILFNIFQQDSIKESQILYNGTVWRNKYFKIRGYQFLFSKEFLKGTISINGKTFNNINIGYDIYNDEIITPTYHGVILQLNKEMVDSFTINFNNKTYRFIKIQEDSVKGFKGYANVLYEGKTSVYVRYRKEIELLAVEGTFDMFYQTPSVWLVKDRIVHPVADKLDLFKALEDNKLQIRNYIKINKLRVSKRDPESFVPIVRFYDSICY